MKERRPPKERFWEKVDRRGPDECWLWVGSLNPKGYGHFRVAGKTVRAHRFSYERFVGPIPESLTIDHLCRTPGCVNPAHLEPVTMTTNVLRGEGWTARNARKTHCPKGHPYDEANTYHYRGGRTCRICQKARSAAYKARVRARASA